MSFRVKLRVKHMKLPDLIEHARLYRKAVDDAWRLPDYQKGNQCVPSGCSKCGLKFTDPLGRPVTLGYVCHQPGCPTGLGGSTCSVQNGLWTGQVFGRAH